MTDGRFSEVALDPAATRGQMRNIAAASDGSLWIGGGIPALLHLRVEGDPRHELESVATPDLASTDVQIVRFDTRGWLWVGTDLGSQRLRRHHSGACSHRRDGTHLQRHRRGSLPRRTTTAPSGSAPMEGPSTSSIPQHLFSPTAARRPHSSPPVWAVIRSL